MKCEIRFFVLEHFGTKWFDDLKMSPFLSNFEVDSRPRVSTPCRGGSHHSIGNVQWHGCTSAAGSGSLGRSVNSMLLVVNVGHSESFEVRNYGQ